MSWSLLGQLAVVGTNQGVSVLINIYYTVAVNAAMGISNSVTNIAANFVSNFQIAFNPQIIKLYNNKDFSRLETLVFRSSKISSYLIMVFIIPIFFEIKNILYFWLGEYPKYSVEFILFTLLAIYFDSISAPLWMIIYSQTNIRRYQIVISSVYSLNFFLGWLFLLMGAYPYSVIGVRIVVFVFLLLVRLSYVKMIFPLFNTRKWLKDVLLKSICISLLSVAIVFVVYSTLDCMPFYHMVLIVIISVLTTVSLIYLLGFDNEERLYIKQYLLNLLRR